jgi:D-glycero-D-manno-heptose 1,7-bisphosphate phosphatase
VESEKSQSRALTIQEILGLAQSKKQSARRAPGLFWRIRLRPTHNESVMILKRAIFLDRDGTLIKEKEYLRDPAQVEVFPEAFDSLQHVVAAGFTLFIVTNQSGVGRGYFTLADVDQVNARVIQEFQQHGVAFQKIYIAPEVPDQPSRGRKPSPQFLFDARDEFGIDLASSYMIGDKLIDLECGWNAGVSASILVRTGYGRKVEREAAAQLAHAVVVDDLSLAADWILKQK